MEILNELPIWVVALLIFALRVTDVSLGTMRTLSVVEGRITLSVLLGFVEILIWVTAISQVIVRIDQAPLLAVAYAGGFAAGNACGIMLDRTIATGSCVVRMITRTDPSKLIEQLHTVGAAATSFAGSGVDGPRTLLFTHCPRRDLEDVLAAARQVDPGLFYTVERFTRTEHAGPLPHPTGWRAVLKKK